MALSQFDTGLWLGTCSAENGGYLQWSLTSLIVLDNPQKFAPQGVVQKVTRKLLGLSVQEQDVAHVITGSIDDRSGVAEMTLVPFLAGATKLFVSGRFDASHNFIGSLRRAETREPEQIILARQDGDAVFGLLCGAALPHPSLADFLLPTNPMTWAVLVLGDTVLGGGLFEDSGDIAGRTDGLLCFAVRGRLLGPPGTRTIELTKVYEDAPETRGIVVHYSGRVSEVAGRVQRASGQWRNSTGTYGAFLCAMQASPDTSYVGANTAAGTVDRGLSDSVRSSRTAAVVFCDSCARWLPPPALHWAQRLPGSQHIQAIRCEACFNELMLNADAADAAVGDNHEPRLLHFPAIVAAPARQPLSVFVAQTLHVFRAAPLLWCMQDGQPQAWSYGSVAALAMAMIHACPRGILDQPGASIM